MNQDIVSIIKQSEKEANDQILATQEETKQFLARKEKEMESRMGQLEQSLGPEITQIDQTARRLLETIEKKEKEKRINFQNKVVDDRRIKAKKFILDSIFKKLWLPR